MAGYPDELPGKRVHPASKIAAREIEGNQRILPGTAPARKKSRLKFSPARTTFVLAFLIRLIDAAYNQWLGSNLAASTQANRKRKLALKQ